jgi:drug/metabolite transporter (DMT)-like permease
MSERSTGTIMLIGAALCWSLGGVLIKSIDLDPLALAGARSAIAGMMIALLYPLLKRSATATARTSERAWVSGARHGSSPSLLDRLGVGVGAIVLGGLAYAGTVILFVASTKMTTAANAILLQYTAPIWVVMLSPLLLREKATRLDWITVLVSFIGIAIFLLDSVSPQARLGDLIALLSGLCFALCIIALRHLRGGGGLTVVLVGNMIAAAIALPSIVTAAGQGTLPGNDIGLLLLLGIGQLGLGYILFTKGIARVTAIEGVLIPVIEPILNPLWVALSIGERPSVSSVIGGLIVLIAVTGRGVIAARTPDRTSA